ncbi:hypothetical protein Poli38472_005868 [Pythium oligandrum]|uniref:RNA polymerase II subunit A C-terminal domain phosphatase n=1 Tax=Pythium oligandrum TaxID=41045 RepID=A0A8K1FLM0_PYTOL|nr:hypothetical protein Poli38472_005868 [Pythium oligandrum]|eukprot:TMW68400.1 hypothetical protein Poli38472_005868 [Pythium oligandrum]
MDGADHIRRKAVVCAPLLAETAAWDVEEGAVVSSGQVLGSVGALELGTHQQLVAPWHGSLRIVAKEELKKELNGDVNGKEDGESDKNQEKSGEEPAVVVAYVEYCIHPIRNGRTCLMCLAIVDENDLEMEEEHRSVSVVSHGQKLRLNVEEAKKFDLANLQRQLTNKRLSLVLDLDHTLLHAVRVQDVVGEIRESPDTHFFYIPGTPQHEHVVKLRPGLTSFLEELSLTYDLFIYTHGTRLYAEEIAKIIDPEGRFFRHRIVARTDTPDMQHKSLKLLFPSCDDSMILVLDDRVDVWKENVGNVFLIEPYRFFKGAAEINNAAGQGSVGVEDEDADADIDKHLFHAKRVLTHVHQAFYENGTKEISLEDQIAGKGSDVKQLLVEHKKSILTGCHIVFSGLFPIQGPRKPDSHYLWRLAVELGAVPSVTMDNFPITHLVIHPGRLDTQKHNQARSMPNVQVVTPEWMLKCARVWERVPETEFLADLLKLKQSKKAEARTMAEEKASEEAQTEDSAKSLPEADDKESKANETSEPNGSGVANGEHSEAKETVQSNKPLPPPILTKEPRNGETPKKSVKFSPEVADNSPTSGTIRRRLVGRRPLNRPVTGVATRIPENKGTVASGGTFDFLSKITQHKREQQKPAETKTPAQQAPKKEAASAPKDIDDAFLRLIEAEEEETAQEQKRKRESDDVKDMLAKRRVKREKPSESAAVTLSDDEDDGEDDLDDLEADILDAL